MSPTGVQHARAQRASHLLVAVEVEAGTFRASALPERIDGR